MGCQGLGEGCKGAQAVVAVVAAEYVQARTAYASTIDMIALCNCINSLPGVYAQSPALTLWLMLKCSHTAQHNALSTAQSSLHVCHPRHHPGQAVGKHV